MLFSLPYICNSGATIISCFPYNAYQESRLFLWVLPVLLDFVEALVAVGLVVSVIAAGLAVVAIIAGFMLAVVVLARE
jgi:hypothetical protein